MLQQRVQEICNEFIKEALSSPRLLEDMAAMEKYMAESYGGRVFIELLQNADDAGSSKIKVCNFNGDLIVANNGRPFSETDVLAISRSGASTKERGTSIGYRGIGFKSTVYLTNEILIYSSDTYFTFSKHICSEKLSMSKEKIPTVRIPFLVTNIDNNLQHYISNLVASGFTTVFIFKNARFDVFSEEISEITNNHFLFLRSIKQCDISIFEHKKFFSLERRSTDQGQLILFSDNTVWLITGNSSIKIAFRFIDSRIVACDMEDAVYHCYLPTLDKICYPLKINGDFSTDPSRKHLTIDDITTKVLQNVAVELFKLVNKAVTTSTLCFVDLLEIFSQTSSFSKANTILCEEFKKIITSRKWLSLNTETRISPAEYKLLPEWLEESEKAFIRQNSSFVKSLSLNPDVYKVVTGLDKFISQHSSSKYATSEFIAILEERAFVSIINRQTYGKILGYIINSGKSSSYIGGKKYNYFNIMIPTSKGIKTFSEIVNVNDISIQAEIKNAISQVAGNSDIAWFCEQVSVRAALLYEDKPQAVFSTSHLQSKQSSQIVAQPSVSRWRSAEQQCIEIEQYLGNNAIDVSKQNIGYDIESTTVNDEKRYIEVKLLSCIGGAFSMTNNEYTAAHQYNDQFYLCLIIQNDTEVKAIYIKNPLSNLTFEKRIRQWEWYCEQYAGEEYKFEIR